MKSSTKSFPHQIQSSPCKWPWWAYSHEAQLLYILVSKQVYQHIIMEKCSNINRQSHTQKKMCTWTYKGHVYMRDCHLL